MEEGVLYYWENQSPNTGINWLLDFAVECPSSIKKELNGQSIVQGLCLRWGLKVSLLAVFSPNPEGEFLTS